jgi:predicted RNA-binding protein with PUA-like domain
MSAESLFSAIQTIMQYWLVKSEPFVYSWDDLNKEKSTQWTGVRNYGARNNLRSMKKGDLVLFYHSNEGLEIVGITKVKKEHFQDPTTEDPNWLAVEIIPYKKLKTPVTLKQIKQDLTLQQMALVKLSRLSVVPVREEEFDRVLELGGM